MWGGGRNASSRLRLPQTPTVADAPALGGRVRGSDRARHPAVQVPGLAAPREPACVAAGRAVGRRRAGGFIGGRGPAASRAPPSAWVQPVRAPRARAHGRDGTPGTGRQARPHTGDTTPGRSRPPVAPEERPRRV